MKNYTLLLFLGSTLSLFAQDSVQYGFHAEMALSKVAGNSYARSGRLGIGLGFFIKKPLGVRKHFQFELNYIQKGSSKSTNPSIGDNDTYLMSLNYLETPFIYQKNFKKFEGEIGLAPSMLLSQSEVMNGSLLSGGVPFYTFNLSLLLGANVLLSAKWTANFRFSTSLLPIRELGNNYVISYYYLPGQFNQFVSLGLYYRLR